MKKILSVILAALLAFSLAACGTTPAKEQSPAGNTSVAGVTLGEKPVEIIFWHSMSDTNGELLEQLVQQFNDTVGREKQITVKTVYQGKYSDATTKLSAVLTADKPADLPDVMQMDATAKILYAESGYAYTLDRLLGDHPDYRADQLYQSLVNNWTYKNARLGMPFAASTTVTYYNKTLFDSIGAAAPETFADLAALGKAPFGEGIEVYTALPNSASLNNWIQQLGGKLLDNDNGTLGNASALTCAGTNDTLKTFLTEWKALYKSGALVNADTTTTDSFVAGKTAVITTSTSNLRAVMDKVDGRFEVGVAKFLRVNADAAVGATSSGSALMAFDKGDAQKMLASWEFMQYLTSAEVQANWAVGTGYLPVNTGAEEVPAYKEFLATMPQFGVGVGQLLEMPLFTSVTIGPAADFYYAVQNNISEMLTNDLSVEDTIANMTEELEGMLYEYNRANP